MVRSNSPLGAAGHACASFEGNSGLSSSPDRLELVEPDDETYADYAASFEPYNSEQSGWDMRTFSLVLRNADGVIVARGAGAMSISAR